VLWFHDESTFFAHDCRKYGRVFPGVPPELEPKGEGPSLMVADFVSAEYGFLSSCNPADPDLTQLLFRAGKSWDGYMTSDDVVDHVNHAMDILDKHYPDEHHIFIFDNARTHVKRADNALSARNMPKGPSKTVQSNAGGYRAVRDQNGKLVRDRENKVVKEWVPMQNRWYYDDEGCKISQPLYFPPNHPTMPGRFIGTEAVLVGRGYNAQWVHSLKASCKGFKCPVPEPDQKPTCCCRRLLFSEPDFATEDTIVEETCEARGYDMIFLPKFHCELNPIEQCWGYAKQRYRKLPRSSSDTDLERNVLQVLDEIPLSTIRRYCQRLLRFTDAYHRGLSGRQASWAAKKYHGHRTCPDSILADLDQYHIVP
jgi:hypothetical protein